MVCEPCGRLLADKQLYYERELRRLTIEETKNIDEEKKKLINKIGLKRYCCRGTILTYTNQIDFVS